MNACFKGLKLLVSVLRELGFYINWRKVEGPSLKLVFLGILITLSLLQGLAVVFVALLKEFVVSKHELQSLIGKLNWA